MSVESLGEAFDLATVAALAGPRVFERGVGYHNDGRVAPPVAEGGRLAATVKGTMPYSVQLWIDQDEQQWSCTCPAAEDGSFCKHAVAVALSLTVGDRAHTPSSVVEGDRSSSRSAKRGSASNSDKDLVALVRALSSERLAEIVLHQAASDWRLRELLLAEAQAARGVGVDMAALRNRIDRAFAPDAYSHGDYVSYAEAPGWADGVYEVIDALEDLCDAGHHGSAARLAEHAYRCADRSTQHVDDSDGWLSHFSAMLSTLHLRACQADPPDPPDLAIRLVELELGSELGGFHRSASAYAEILGANGLASFREHVLSHCERITSDGIDESTDRFLAHNAMVGWALGTGDPDLLIEIHGQRRPLPEDMLEIVQDLDRAGRADEAIDWARRGLAEWGHQTWKADALRDFLAEKLRDPGDERPAVDLYWQVFVSRPSIGEYRRLFDEDKDQNWPVRCGDHLRNLLDRDFEPGTYRRATAAEAFGVVPPFVPDPAVALVEILLFEGRTDEAWQVAVDYGCRAQMWLTLAQTREQDNPQDAMAVYESASSAIIERTDAKQYQSAVDLMVRHRRLAESAGVPERFGGLLERSRTEHRPKRKLQALLDAQGW